MIAALYVAKGGCYFGLPDVDPWDESRDARLYGGPWPVVAHPPCERWGKFWNGGPWWVTAGEKTRGRPAGPARPPKIKGDDSGCFAAALAAVRKYGGVLEHPVGSAAWAHFGLHLPPSHGWIVADQVGGWTCRVEQGHYGHRARKGTMLYANGVVLPSLIWGPDRRPRKNVELAQWMTKRERAATPLRFRDLLLAMAASRSGGHYCPEWDEMLIDDRMPEFAACMCFRGRTPAGNRGTESGQ